MTAHLTPQEMPTPSRPSAFLDNNGAIWLWEHDPPSITGKWRIPGGTLAKPGNRVLAAALVKHDVTELRRMLPVRRRP